MRGLPLLAVVSFVSACAFDDEPVVVCPDKDIAITQGVYGMVMFYEYVARTSGRPAVETTFTILDGDDVLVAMPSVDERGIYEEMLEPGTYAICFTEDRCADFTLAAGERVRIDFHGFWTNPNQNVGSCTTLR